MALRYELSEDRANFELFLNSAADIRVLVRPSFWTLQRMLILVAALLGVLVLAVVWIWPEVRRFKRLDGSAEKF